MENVRREEGGLGEEKGEREWGKKDWEIWWEDFMNTKVSRSY